MLLINDSYRGTLNTVKNIVTNSQLLIIITNNKYMFDMYILLCCTTLIVHYFGMTFCLFNCFVIDFSAVLSCWSSPCHNGASCTNINGGFICSCLPGWTGSLCEASKFTLCNRLTSMQYNWQWTIFIWKLTKQW